MKIDILTLFPKMFDGFLSESIIKRAINNKCVEINVIDFRKYSTLKNGQVDDTPYGGGVGMVLMCEPVVRAIEDLKKDDSLVILTCPQGKVYNENAAHELKKVNHLIIICGHYEGYDERIRNFVDLEISIGDYILTGGEIPAMVITDSIVRLIPGVINKESYIEDSFTNNLLDYPTYTKPADFRGMKVPDVLISGNHAKIAEYRKNEQIKRTGERRPELLEKHNEK
ncbi:MAG: tRNA (guanosine(37)-N1)-methyltransferase TrmD [Firmicutes bacterium]|nr:tRNA (guanosine(37)-N1)-methyltransferase TrmD [Bacillota bacterium]